MAEECSDEYVSVPLEPVAVPTAGIKAKVTVTAKIKRAGTDYWEDLDLGSVKTEVNDG